MVTDKDWKNLKLLHSPQGYLSKKERKERLKNITKAEIKLQRMHRIEKNIDRIMKK